MAGHLIAAWKKLARLLKVELQALYLAYRDPRVPWHARVFAACVVGYAFSPIDLIPDPIPVLGYLDDLVLVPLGIVLARRMIPAAVLAEHREIARVASGHMKPKNWIAAAIIVAIWAILAIAAAVLVARWTR